MRRIPPVIRQGTQILHLHQLIPRARRIARQTAFRTFEVKKLVRLVGPLVHRRAAVFRKPDGLGPGQPARRLCCARTADTIVVQVLPPAAQVLVTVNPRLPMGAIGDRRTALRRARLGRMVIPIKPFATRNITRQIVERINAVAMLRVQMICTVAPIGQRHIIVDTDEIDRVVGPQRIKVKEHIAAAILRVIAEIFGPIRSIADLGARAQKQPRFCGQRAKRLHRDKAVPRPADLRQPAHLGADAKGLYPACGFAQGGIMQDEPRHRPFLWAGIDDLIARNGKIRRRDRAEERRYLVMRAQRPVRAARLTRRFRQRDPPPPRQLGLGARIAIGIG